MTLRETTDIIKEFCANEPNVGFVDVGDVYELNAQQNIQYPSMVITQQTHSVVVDKEWYRFHFVIFYVDRLTEDKSNENQVQSTAITVLEDIIKNIEQMGIFSQYDYTYNTFTEKFESLCAGAYVDIQLNVPIADCDWDTVYDYFKKLFESEVEHKQDKLISGFNIKTINGESLLGGGDLILDIPDEIEIVEGDYIKITRSRGRAIDEVEKNVISVVELPEMIEDNTNKINHLDEVKADKSEIPTNYVDGDTYDSYTARTDAKIAEIEAKGYDDTEVRQLISGNTEAIAELEANKANKDDLETLEGSVNAISGEVTTLNEKVSEIEEKGYLSKDDADEYYQPKGEYALKSDIPDLTDYAKKEDIPTDYVDNDKFDAYSAETAQKIAEIEAKGYDDTEVRQLISGNTQAIDALEGSVTALDTTVEELSSKVDNSVSESDFETYTASTKTELDNKADKSDIPSLDGYATEQWVEDKGYSTFSGSYNDLTDKPTIPTDYVNNATYNAYTADTAQKIAEIEAKGYDDTEVRQLISGNTQAIQNLDNTKQPKGDYALKSDIPTDYATEDDITTAIGNQKFKTINNESILGTGNIVITGATGNYLPLTGGTLTGHLTLGSTAETAFKKVEAIRNSNSQANGAAFYVNSDGTAAFFHKAYNGASATNDAILKFDSTGLQFAKGGSRGTSASVYYDVMTSENTYDKTYIDDTIGNIEELLSRI